MEADGGSASAAAAMQINVPRVPSLQLAVNTSLPASLQRWRGSRRGAQRAEIIAQLRVEILPKLGGPGIAAPQLSACLMTRARQRREKRPLGYTCFIGKYFVKEV